MKRLALTLAILAAPVFPALAQPQPTPDLQGDAAPGGHDGPMSLTDFQARQRARTMRMDADHDGRISLAEWTAWRASHPGREGAAGGDPNRGFQRTDLNQDGYITPDEIDAASARRFARMDANHDGVVTPDERSAMHHGGGGDGVQPLSPR